MKSKEEIMKPVELHASRQEKALLEALLDIRNQLVALNSVASARGGENELNY
jgi:hypothetical protein